MNFESPLPPPCDLVINRERPTFYTVLRNIWTAPETSGLQNLEHLWCLQNDHTYIDINSSQVHSFYICPIVIYLKQLKMEQQVS